MGVFYADTGIDVDLNTGLTPAKRLAHTLVHLCASTWRVCAPMSVSVFTLARNARVHVRTRAGPNVPSALERRREPLRAGALPMDIECARAVR